MRIAAAVLIFFVATAAQAADSGPLQSARRLSRLMLHFLEENGEPTCLPDRAAFSEEFKRGYVAKASNYGGISPQSAYWPEVEEINYQYRTATCAMTISPTDRFAEALASEASAADLDAAVAFYSSPTGQRILSASVKAAKKISTTSQTASPQKEAADLAYRESLRTLVAKYRLDPK